MASITETFHSGSPYGTFRMHLPEDPLARQQRAQRQKVAGKFPPTLGIHEPLSFQHSDHNFRAREETGETRADAPRRQDTPVVDTINGFVSVGADVEDGNYKTLEPLIHKNPAPQVSNPYERLPGSPLPATVSQKLQPWQTKNTVDGEFEQNYVDKYPNNKEFAPKVNNDSETTKSKQWRDAVALKAFYTSETQRMYKGVDWANKLPPPILPPSSTLELSPDVVTRTLQEKRYDHRPRVWQQLGSSPMSWDFIQSRSGNYSTGRIDFCSPNKKNGQIPGYTGCTLGRSERDNPNLNFASVTLVRTHKPRYTDTAKRSNLPGYSGVPLFHGAAAPIKEIRTHSTTTGRTYRKLQVPSTMNLSPFRRESHMSKMVTLVHPFNPYNTVRHRT